MRIHELLDQCVEWISHDGALGCDPVALQQHLQKRDASIDDSYFGYIWGSLVQHPSIEVVLARHPLPRPDGTVILGTAPLPDDYVPPAEVAFDIEELYSKGMRGRQIAYQLAGLEYRTSKQSIQDNKQLHAGRKSELEAEKKVAAGGKPAGDKGKTKTVKGKEKGASAPTPKTPKIKREGPDVTDVAPLIRVLADDDGEGDSAILKSDLKGLQERWGSRLRIRCTDQEIYYRLTGSHQQLPRISAQVLFVLQLAARSRQAGITALDLGPLLNTAQGSISYFIGVLLEANLIHKYRTALNGASTNYIVFHKYAEQYLTEASGGSNSNKRVDLDAALSSSIDHVGDDGVDESGPSVDQTPMADLAFGPLSERDVMIGPKIQERLVQLLEHPSLDNHLLKNRELLRLLGWQGEIRTRHRRALLKQQKAMVAQGLLERLQVGPERVLCLRLTKFASDDLPMAQRLEEDPAPQGDVSGATPPAIHAADYAEPFNPVGGIPLTLTVEHQFLRYIVDSGRCGRTLTDLRSYLALMFKRTIETLVSRYEADCLPPHLAHYAVAPTMEYEGKEKRLRYYGIEAFRQVLAEQGQSVDEAKHPLPGPEAGRFADLSFRQFWSNRKTLGEVFEQGDYAELDLGPGPIGRPRKDGLPAGSTSSRYMTIVKPARSRPRPNAAKRDMLYDDEVQVRGRPRKYLYVVNEDGKVNRHIIGSVIPTPGIAPVWIYVEEANKLVEAPKGYTGLGVPPKVAAEQLKNGKTPKWFDKFERKEYGDKKKGGAKKGKAAAKGKKKAKTNNDDGDADELMEEEQDHEQAAIGGDGVATPSAEADAETAPTCQHSTERPADVGGPLQATTSGASDGTAIRPSSGTTDAPGAIGMEAGEKGRSGRTIAAEAAQAVVPEASSVPATQITTDASADMFPPTQEPPAGPESQGKTTGVDADIPTAPKGKRGRPKRPVAEAPLDELKPKRLRVNKRAKPQVEAAATPDPVETLIAVDSPMHSAPQAADDSTDGDHRAGRDRSPSPALREVSQLSHGADAGTQASSDIKPVLPQPAKTMVRNGRVDLYGVRRQNELCQVLLENQGVLDKAGLYAAHTTWVKRVAGTDHPHAPNSPASMDRAVFNRTLRALFNDGRVKETNASMVLNTKWISVPIAYLPEISQDAVQAFIRSLASSTSQALSTPARRMRTAKEIPAAKFTEIKVGGMSGPGTPATPTLVSSEPEAPLATPRKEARREALLKQPGLGSFLYGYQSGRFARARTLHRGVIAALSSGRTSSSIVSADGPRIFALPMMYEDIPSEAWFASIAVPQYDEKLEQWLQQPENRFKPVSEVPAHICPPGGFSGASYRTRILAVFAVLAELQLITPLILRDSVDQADITCLDANTGTEMSFSTGEKDLQTGYYVHNDLAPIYHIASDDQRLLGVLRVHSTEDADAYWSILKQACLQPDSGTLDPLPSASDHVLPPYLSIDSSCSLSAELQQTLRHKARWSPDIRLLPVQRDALQQSIDWSTGRQLVTSREDIERLAWTNALPLAYVEKYLAVKGRQAADVLAEKQRIERAAAKQQFRRQEKSRADLRRKLEQRRAEAKVAWDQRVASAALKEGEVFSPEMADFVRKATLLATQRQALTDAVLADAIKAYKRARERGDEFTGQRTSGTFVKLPKVPKKVVIDSLPDGRRRRKRWTAEADELLLDCEAILVARAGGRRNAGRSATLQVLPDLSNQVLMNRLRKILDLPGQQAFFDKLVSAWTHIWLEHRGTDLLPDHNPESVNDVDMVKHLSFLREQVDKSALRSSISAETAAVAAQPVSIELPTDVDALLEQYRIDMKPHVQLNLTTSIDAAISDDAKYGIMTSLSLTRQQDGEDPSPVLRGQDELRVALMTIVATPDESFDSRISERVLSAWPASKRTRAIQEMVDDKILVRRTHHNSTGRGYVFAQSWLQAGEGPLSQDVFSDAKGTTNAIHQPEGMSWPIIGKSGDIAALLELVSKDQVDISFELDSIPSLHHHRQKYNTRRMNDDYFEFPLRVSARPSSNSASVPAAPRPLPGPDGGQGRFAQWKDIHGRVIEAEWRKALQCASGYIVQKPGISEASLRRMLDPMFERTEVNEVLTALLDGQMARRSWIDDEEHEPLPASVAIYTPDEAKIAWWPIGAGVFC